MANIRVDTLASAMRELRKRVDIVPFENDVPEESIGLAAQRYIDPVKWGVTPIECWSKTQRRQVATKNIWEGGWLGRTSLDLRSRVDGLKSRSCFVLIIIQGYDPIPLSLSSCI
jgi:hypothetical protein